MRPVTPERLREELADLLAGAAAGREDPLRVAVDGADAADPDGLAADLVDLVERRGPAVRHVRAGDFLRPRSVRLERGHEDPDAYAEDWWDVAALHREVLDPLEPGGTGLRPADALDPVSDRATRAEPVALPSPGVLLLSGPLLLGRWSALDLTVHWRCHRPRSPGSRHPARPGRCRRWSATARRWLPRRSPTSSSAWTDPASGPRPPSARPWSARQPSAADLTGPGSGQVGAGDLGLVAVHEVDEDALCVLAGHRRVAGPVSPRPRRRS